MYTFNVLLCRLVLSVLLLGSCTVSNASDWEHLSQPVFYTPLGQSSRLEGAINSVVKDPQGFIWLATSSGFWRWDSHSLLKAQFSDNPQHAYPPLVQFSFSGPNGKIWVGTSKGLYQLDPATTLLTPVSEKLSGISVLHGAATQFQQQDIVIISADRALYQFNLSTQQLTPVPLPVATRIHAVHVDSNNTLWIGTGAGLYTAINHGGEFGPLQAANNFPANTRVSAIVSMQGGILAVGTAAAGLYILNPDGSTDHIAVNGEHSPAWIYAMTEVRSDVLLLGTFGHGLTEVNIATRAQRHFQHNPLQPAGLSDNNIWSVFCDSEGLAWIGTGNKLNVYHAASTAIKHIYGGTGQANGIQQRKVHSLVALNDTLIMGTGKSGLESLTPTAGSASQWWLQSNDPVETLYATKNGNLLASANFVTATLSPASHAATHFGVKNRADNAFTNAFAESHHATWLGGTDGLWRVPDEAPDNAVSVVGSAQQERRIASLLFKQNTLWIGSWQGLQKIDLSLPLARDFNIESVHHPVLDQQFIAALFIDSLGQLWAGTSGAGLFVMTLDHQWQQLTTENGLPGTGIAAIAGEQAGQLWVSTSRGIAAVDITNLQVSTVVSGRGAVNKPYSRGASTITTNGDIVVGGSHGLTIIDPIAIQQWRRPLNLVFTNISITDNANIFHSPALNGKPFEVSPLPKRLSFEFAALDYLDPEHLAYRFQIEGNDNHWTEVDPAHRVVTITTPQPGKYTLKVQYSNDGTTWQTDTLSQPFTVLPAWYQTRAAAIGGVLLLTVSIFALHQLGLRHYRYRQTVLEQRVNERTTALVAANQKLNEQAAALEQASLTDALTGLHNRRFLNQNINRDISRVHRYYNNCLAQNLTPSGEHDLLFFLIDLDHFKQINDSYGHQNGDLVLVDTQRRLNEIFRESDYLIRWGGEEFLAVVHDTPRSDAPLIAGRILAAINGNAFTLQGEPALSVTCSVGFAAYPLHQEQFTFFDWQSTIAVADATLYGAKNNQRNTWMGVMDLPQSMSSDTLQVIKQHPANVFHFANVSRPEP